MKHLSLLLFGALAVSGALGCNKPTADECRQAITNMEKLLGTEAAARNTDNEGEVRRCRVRWRPRLRGPWRHRARGRRVGGRRLARRSAHEAERADEGRCDSPHQPTPSPFAEGGAKSGWSSSHE